MVKSAMGESPLDGFVALAVAGVVLLPDRGPRLYYRRVGEGFARDSSVVGTLIDIDDAATLGFELPAESIDYLRFDLPAVAGCYRMGPVAIDGVIVEDLARRIMLVHGRRLQDPDSAAQIRLAEWNDAPWFELDVRDLLPAGEKAEPIAVRVTIRKEHAAVEMERRLDAAAAEISKQLEAQAETIRSAIVEIAASASLAQHTAHERFHADLRKSHDQVDRLGAETAQAMADLKLESAALRQQADALRQKVDALRSQLDFLVHYELNRSLVRRALRKVKRAFWK